MKKHTRKSKELPRPTLWTQTTADRFEVDEPTHAGLSPLLCRLRLGLTGDVESVPAAGAKKKDVNVEKVACRLRLGIQTYVGMIHGKMLIVPWKS